MSSNDIVEKQLEYFKNYFDAYRQAKEEKEALMKSVTPKRHRHLVPMYGRKLYRNGEQHLIENYSDAKKDNFKYWHLHHRLELTLDGEYAHSMKDLIRLGMYYNRPYFELIYLPQGVHSTIHTSKDIEQISRWVNLYKM